MQQQQQLLGNNTTFAKEIKRIEPLVVPRDDNTKEHPSQTWEAPSFEGIKLSEIQHLNGISLRRNGHGLRSIQFFGMEVKVYVAGFYSQKPLLTENDVMTCRDTPMVLDFTFLRSVSKKRVTTAWQKQMEYSSSHRYEGFEADSTAFSEMLASAIESGGTQTVQIVGDDTIVIDQGAQKGRIRGRDFQKAFLSMFFGERAVTEELKSGLLNGDAFRVEERCVRVV
eukprot:CAMPEP_0198262388 /NCGR_PEP_ID=MMETSP1447-20131203/10900_1 /TAXON_ID=420782 /ORGANISM="Chaetoceros dichaeta, Strain CCMP1751" /LENGTH=224 /DNA_ID=CAMNT_0043950607 /DNA_START=223 /DNA_END=897 /DNA_ORIENTATION=-